MSTKDVNKSMDDEKSIPQLERQQTKPNVSSPSQINEHVIPATHSTHGKDLTSEEELSKQQKNPPDETQHLNSPKSTSDGSMLSDTMDYSRDQKKP